MKLLLVVLAALACNIAFASGQTTHLVHAKGAGLTLISRKLDEAKFSGQAWVTGTLVGRWPAGAGAVAYKAPEYLLVPDAASSAKLPYFVLREPPYFNSYRVRTIEIQNGETALRLALGQKAAGSLVHRRVNAIRASGAFLIKEYSVGVECDAPWARALVVKAKIPDRVVQAHLRVPEGC